MVKFYSFLSLKVSCEQPYFHIGMGSSPLTGKFQEEPNEPIMTFLTTPPPSILNEFRMNLPSRVICKPKMGFSRS